MTKALLFLAAMQLGAADAREILREVRARSAFRSLEYRGQLTVVERKKPTLDRQWLYRAAGDRDTRKVTIRFLNPPDIRGVALLILNQVKGPAIQWLWVPSLGRDRRIAAQDRSASVFGMDFTFEDLEDRNRDDYLLTLLEETTIDGAACYKIEARQPDARPSQYDSTAIYVDKSQYVVRKLENFKGRTLAREIRFSQFQNIDGIFTPFEAEAYSPARDSRTTLKLDRIRYNLPFKNSDFSREALRLP